MSVFIASVRGALVLSLIGKGDALRAFSRFREKAPFPYKTCGTTVCVISTWASPPSRLSQFFLHYLLHQCVIFTFHDIVRIIVFSTTVFSTFFESFEIFEKEKKVVSISIFIFVKVLLDDFRLLNK